MLIGHLLFAQGLEDTSSDFLSTMDYDELFVAFQEEQDQLIKKLYLIAYLNKAKKDNNPSKMVAGYKNLLHHSPVYLRSAYADSMILTAQKFRDTSLLTSSYLTKGIVYYGNRMYQKALKQYLIADDLASRIDTSAYLSHKIKFNIGCIKFYLGDYEEALRLYKGCLNFYKGKYPRPYLNTIHAISLCYNHLGDYNKSNNFNALGLKTGLEVGNQKMDPYFIHSQGINAYHLQSYQKAIELITGVLIAIEKNNDFAKVTLGKFYIGMSLWELNRFEEAILYFEEVDKTFEHKNYIEAEFRNAYRLLVSYYTEKRNQERRNYYTNRLIEVDSVIHNRYKILSSTVHKDYNMAKLQDERVILREKSSKLEQYRIIWQSVAVVLFTIILWWSVKRLRIYSKLPKRFRGAKLEEPTDSKYYIPTHTYNEITKQLKEFERQKDYLQDISLGNLAAKFETNSKYLSKVIHDIRSKAFSTYINDLKVEELKRILKKNKNIREFNYNALVEIVGFGTVSRLTRAFKSRTNTTIAEYIKQLEAMEKKKETQGE